MHKLRLIVLMFVIWPTLIWAQDVRVHPDLFDVTGVASNDVLNIRQLPSASSAIVGALAHNSAAVEVIGTTSGGRWGLVNFGDGSGWVSMRYMARRGGWSGVPPRGLLCLGTEPFWSFHFDPSGQVAADFSPMGLGGSVYHSVWSAPFSNRATGSYGFATGPEATSTGVIGSGVVRTELCSDGMSDRVFGFSIDLILSGSTRMALSGCCRIESH